MSAYHTFVGQQYRSLNTVFQFTNVTWPMITAQHIDGWSRNSTNILVVNLTILLNKVVRYRNDIRFSLAQSRNLNWENIEPVVEI